MDDRDPFPRRTATPALMVPWLVELLRTLPGLIDSYVIGRPLDSRTRERVIMAVTEVNGCRYCAWIHGGWQQYLGEGLVGLDDALLAYARACAEAGEPLDPSPLAEVMPADAVRAVRATVAQIEVANLVGNTADGLLARLTRKRPASPLAALQEMATVAVALPIAVPMLGTAAVFRAVGRAAPPMPTIELPPAGEANLLVHLLAQTLPGLLSNAAIRLAVLGLPATVSVGLRAGRTGATTRVGRGRVVVENGIANDAFLVVEGDVQPLLQLATGSIVRELTGVRIRPNQ